MFVHKSLGHLRGLWSDVHLSTCVSQIFVEIERARLTRRLAAIKEEEGNIAEAADTLQEVPVVRMLVCMLASMHVTEQAEKSHSPLPDKL